LDFDPQALDIYQTANYLQARTDPEERIFIWGTQPAIYALAERSPVGRYSTSYHVIDFDGYQETIEALKKHRPRYLVVTNNEDRPFPEFFSFLNFNYAQAKQFGAFEIYHQVIQ
jgi:hypothetical protein